jgi:hypothetical protein
MSDLFTDPADVARAQQRDRDHQRLRAAGFNPYSGTGQPSGYWQRRDEASGFVRVHREAEALRIVADEEARRALPLPETDASEGE